MKKIISILIILILSGITDAQWSVQNSGTSSSLWSVSAVDNNIVWVCGSGGKVLRTTNGGEVWNLTTSPNPSLNLYNIWGINDTISLVAGSGTAAIVYKTVNGGMNWSQVFYQSGGYINAISGLSLITNDTLFMYGDPVGSRWSLWRSVNAGNSWDSSGWYLPASGAEGGYWNGMFCLRGSYYDARIWFGTNNTRIYKYSFGQGWTVEPTTGSTNVFRILFTNSLNGIASGESKLLFSANGGQNWVLSGNIPGSGWITGLAYINQTNIFYARSNSIYFSSNGGTSWFLSVSQSGSFYHLGKARTGNNLWGVTDNGGIFKYTASIGIKQINTVIPEKYSVSQNFPNPFNSSTNIRYSILKKEYVKIDVFDIFGKLIETPVNGRHDAGTYELSFNASQYSSGTYYYKFCCGDYIDVKKMVLIK